MKERTIKEAVDSLVGLAERWETTKVWHNPPFLDGNIEINTGNLRDISIVVREMQKVLKLPHPIRFGVPPIVR
jgi:hypothetical protein